MKKYIGIIIGIILIIITITIIINKNSKEYIMQDGIMLALTLDGEKVNSYPEGSNYGVEINCENGKGKWLVEEWKLAVEEVTGNVICNIDFTSNPTTLISKVEEVNVNNNYNSHGYRYSGSNPNNYIWFNNEMWRIIGSIPTCLSASCGTNTTNLVKIIREESIGSIAIDAKSSSYTGLWGNNTLYKLLNNYYYGALDGTESGYCHGYQNIQKTKCNYTAIGINPDSYYGEMVKNVYWNTGTTGYAVTPYNAFTAEKTTITVAGYVGLMNASDYGYATDSSYFGTNMGKYNTVQITESNWLYGKSNGWTNTGNTTSNYSILVANDGRISVTTACGSSAVMPTIYLDSSVYIISGDGTEVNPYQIGM